MTATRVFVLASVFLWTGAVRAETPALLLLRPRGETALDSRSLSRAVAIYTRDLGFAVRIVPTPFSGATIAGIRQAAALVQRRNARLAFWCEPRSRHTFALYTVNRDGEAGRRVIGGSQRGQVELYRAIALKLRAILAGSGAVANDANEEIARPPPPSEREVAPAWQVVSPPNISPSPPPAGSSAPATSAASPPPSAIGATAPREPPVAAQEPAAAEPVVPAPRSEETGSGSPPADPGASGSSAPPPLAGPAVISPAAPPRAAPAGMALPAARSLPALSSRPARRAASPATLFGTVSYRVLAPSGLAPLRQGVDLEGALRVAGSIELNLGVEVAPEAHGQGGGGAVSLLDLPLRIGARLVRQREVLGVGAGAYVAAHYLHATATDVDDQQDDASVAAGFGFEALGRARLLGEITLEIQLFAELLAPYNQFSVHGVPVLAAGSRVGAAMGVVFPFL